MTIGSTIRQYRKELGLTQAQLAQKVGVSVQAVSKWETGAGFPDISQIVPLARALGISTDKLLGFNDRREDFEKLWQDTVDRSHADPCQMREVSLAALELYPEDKLFLLRAAVDEEELASMTEEKRVREGHLHNALGYSRRLLRLDPDNTDAKIRMVRIYSQLGMDDQAVALAYQCTGAHREHALKYCLKGDALRHHIQKIVDRKLTSLLSELSDGDLEMLDAAERILRAAIPDGNYQHYYEFLAGIYVKRFAHYREDGQEQAACAALRQVLELAREADAERNRAFTAPLFDLLENRNPPGIPDRAWRWLLSYVEDQIPQWREEPPLAEIVTEAYAYLTEQFPECKF